MALFPASPGAAEGSVMGNFTPSDTADDGELSPEERKELQDAGLLTQDDDDARWSASGQVYIVSPHNPACVASAAHFHSPAIRHALSQRSRRA